MRLRDSIVGRFPIGYEKYIEVFGGAAWVLFHKERTKFEVYNDFNTLLVNVFRQVRDKPEELKAALKYQLCSRADFDLYRRELFELDTPMSEVERAAKYFNLIRNSYASGITSFSCQPHDIWADFPEIDAANTRLRGVLIENRSFDRLIPHYDSSGSFFYCDPPYYGTEGHYTSNFTRESHAKLAELLRGIKGDFLLSYNDCDEIRELYKWANIEEISRLDNIAQRVDPGRMYRELLISNYDTTLRRKQHEQTSLFATENKQILMEAQ